MKKFSTLTLLLLFFYSLFSQTDQINQLITEGIKYHDQGKFKSAISKYQEAIDLDKNCSAAYYEMSYTYFSMGNYDEAIKNAEKVIKLKNGSEALSYVMIGNCYDLNDQYSKAVKNYLKGIKAYPEEQMLFYNLALTYQNHKEYQKAEEIIIKSIQLKPTHASSHFLYGLILDAQGKTFQSTIPLYFALSLEPTSKRSNTNLKWLKKTLDYNVQKEGNTINISLNMFGDKSDPISSCELSYKIFIVNELGKDSLVRTDQEKFIIAIQNQIQSLKTVKLDDDDFFMATYLKPLYQLLEDGLVDALSYNISQSLKSEEIKNWITNNPEKIEKLDNWLNHSLNGNSNK